MKIKKDGTVIEVSEKAYQVVYREHGYAPVTEDDAKPARKQVAKHADHD